MGHAVYAKWPQKTRFQDSDHKNKKPFLILDRHILWVISTYGTDMKHVIAAERAVILLCSDSNPVSFIIPVPLIRWFKFTLKPPNSIMTGNLLSAIWDTSHWNFFLKFGLKTAWDISYDILWSILTYVKFWRLQGRLSTFAKIWGPQKIKVFSMKEWSVVDEAWGF